MDKEKEIPVDEIKVLSDTTGNIQKVEEKSEEVKEVKKPVAKKEEKSVLSSLSVAELKEAAKEKGISGYSKFKKDELIAALSK